MSELYKRGELNFVGDVAELSDIKAWLAGRGLVAVPLEPTDPMKQAGKVAVDCTSACSGEHDQPCSYCDDGFKHPDGCGYAAVAGYKAMILAAQGEADG